MFHKEGLNIILSTFVITAILMITLDYLEVKNALPVKIFLIIMLGLVLQFFRNPKITVNKNENHILSAVDGKVVIIKEVFEPEFFKEKKLQVSIFMSPLNVHVTRYPISGDIIFSKYHSGAYLVAWHPKSSTKNERTTIVLQNKVFGKILYRQIAGALARRIVNYAKVGDSAEQGKDSGFIKFGSRVDLFLPIGTKVNVKLNQKVKGGITVIASKN